MLVLAKTIKGKEFIYNPNSARQVSKASAENICKVVNERKYLLNNPGECWYIYNVDRYDNAYYTNKAFRIRCGIITDCIVG